jgi:hypothetical protein
LYFWPADLPNSKTSHWGAGVTAEEMKEMQWVKPKLVAQVRFVEWTADGHLRHSAFLGLRADKNTNRIRRECEDVMSDLELEQRIQAIELQCRRLRALSIASVLAFLAITIWTVSLERSKQDSFALEASSSRMPTGNRA